MQKVKTISGAAAIIKRKPFIVSASSHFAKNEHNLFIFQFIILDMRAPHTRSHTKNMKMIAEPILCWLGKMDIPFYTPQYLQFVCYLIKHSLHSHFLCASPSRHMRHFNESIQTIWRG